MTANRQVSPLAVILFLVAIVAGGLVAYLLYSASDAPERQLITAAPEPASPAPAPSPPPAVVQPDPVRTDDGFATVEPDVAESDVHPQVQQQGLALVEAVVGQYEAAWPWVRQALERSDVRFYDRRLPAPCDRAGVVGCVVGAQLLLTLQGVQSEQTVLHELGHVWNNTAGEDWGPIQQAFADHYAGCYSRRASTPERLQTELLVDAMVIAAGAAIGDFSLGGFGYYEGGLWSDGFAGCLVDSSEPAPHLLDAIRVQLFDCGLDADAAAAEARAQAIEEDGSVLRLRTGAETRTAQWAAMAPRLCAHTAAGQERTLDDLAAVVAQYEVPWPWVRATWARSDIQFVEDLTAACGDAAVFDLNVRYDFFNPEAHLNPPPVACVREARILVSHSAATADRDEIVAPLLQVLARVWNRTTDDEDWATVQAAFAEHLAGCRSASTVTPDAVQEGAIADTMMSVFGVSTARGTRAPTTSGGSPRTASPSPTATYEHNLPPPSRLPSSGVPTTLKPPKRPGWRPAAASGVSTPLGGQEQRRTSATTAHDRAPIRPETQSARSGPFRRDQRRIFLKGRSWSGFLGGYILGKGIRKLRRRENGVGPHGTVAAVEHTSGIRRCSATNAVGARRVVSPNGGHGHVCLRYPDNSDRCSHHPQRSAGLFVRSPCAREWRSGRIRVPPQGEGSGGHQAEKTRGARVMLRRV